MLSSDIYGLNSIKNLKELGSPIYDSVLRFNETRAAEVSKLKIKDSNIRKIRLMRQKWIHDQIHNQIIVPPQHML